MVSRRPAPGAAHGAPCAGHLSEPQLARGGAPGQGWHRLPPGTHRGGGPSRRPPHRYDPLLSQSSGRPCPEPDFSGGQSCARPWPVPAGVSKETWAAVCAAEPPEHGQGRREARPPGKCALAGGEGSSPGRSERTNPAVLSPRPALRPRARCPGGGVAGRPAVLPALQEQAGNGPLPRSLHRWGSGKQGFLCFRAFFGLSLTWASPPCHSTKLEWGSLYVSPSVQYLGTAEAQGQGWGIHQAPMLQKFMLLIRNVLCVSSWTHNDYCHGTWFPQNHPTHVKDQSFWPTSISLLFSLFSLQITSSSRMILSSTRWRILEKPFWWDTWDGILIQWSWWKLLY